MYLCNATFTRTGLLPRLSTPRNKAVGASNGVAILDLHVGKRMAAYEHGSWRRIGIWRGTFLNFLKIATPCTGQILAYFKRNAAQYRRALSCTQRGLAWSDVSVAQHIPRHSVEENTHNRIAHAFNAPSSRWLRHDRNELGITRIRQECPRNNTRDPHDDNLTTFELLKV